MPIHNNKERKQLKGVNKEMHDSGFNSSKFTKNTIDGFISEISNYVSMKEGCYTDDGDT